jgi:hypothetical protein
MKINFLTKKKWQKLADEFVSSSKANIIENRELGSVVILPIPTQRLAGITITLTPLILHKLNDLHVFSSYIKFEQVQTNFGEILTDTLLDKPTTRINMAGLDLSWHIVRSHFGKIAQVGLTDIFEPHIQRDDLENKIVEESLYKLEPALHFWFGNNYLGLPFYDGVVSLNLMDVATNFVNKLSFEDGSTKYLSKSLWDEVLTRYLSESPLQDQVLQQLDNQDYDDEFAEDSISGVAYA